MFHSSRGFFDQIIIRKILSCFWLSIREISFGMKLKALNAQDRPVTFKFEIKQISNADEMLLKSNFYLRLEIMARGRMIYEPNFDPMSFPSSSRNNDGLVGIDPLTRYQNMYPIHHSIFTSNLRQLSKLLK